MVQCLQEESSIVTQYEELLEVQWCEYRDCLNRVRHSLVFDLVIGY